MPASVGPIGQIAYTVSDVKRAVAFYRDAIGLKLLFEAPPGLAFFDCGGIRLMLSRPEGDFRPGPGAVTYFRISDIEGTQQAMRRRGVPFIDDPHLITRMPDHELWMCFFADPDGNHFALMEERRESPS